MVVVWTCFVPTRISLADFLSVPKLMSGFPVDAPIHPQDKWLPEALSSVARALSFQQQ
jgi:hypothetical protein